MKAKNDNVVSMVKNDRTASIEAHTAARRTLLGQLDVADDLLGTALVSALKMTAQHGATTADEVATYYTRCGSPAQYASMLNLGDKVRRIIGEAATLALIDKAASGKGSGFNRAKAALASVVRVAKDAGEKVLTKAASAKAASAAIKAADASIQKVADLKASRAAALKAGKGSTVAPKPAESAAKVVEAALQCGATHRSVADALRVISQQVRKLNAPEGREAAHKEAAAALATACEAWQVFAK